MEKFKVSFEANNQQLKAIGTKHASDTYADIEAEFVLGNRWTDMDSVSAVWWNDFTRVATVLDSQGKCIVPHEVLARKGCVRVNLVGSIVEGNELVTRLTSYSAEAVQVNEKIKLTGNETSEITPSQYEQFVANVKADADRAEAGATASANSADEAEASAQNASESASASAVSASDSTRSATASAGYAQNASESAQSAENAKDDAEDARDEILGMRATAETLEAGSDATASYSDGLLTLGIPRGDRGEQGIQGETGATPNLTIGTVETLEPTEDATATITGTAEEPVLNLGIPKGDTGEVSRAELDNAVSDLKSDISDIANTYLLNGWPAGEITVGAFYSTDGNYTENANWSCVSEFVEVKGHTPYTAKTFTSDGRIISPTYVVCWYDASETFVSSNINTDNVTSPNNAKYARLSVMNNYKTGFIFTDNYNAQYYPFGYRTSLNENIYDPHFELLKKSNPLYGKVLCTVGDSITQGADMDADGIVTPTIEAYQYNMSTGEWDAVTSQALATYGYQIAERNNMKFYNGGISGSVVAGLVARDGFSLPNGRYTKLPDDIDYLTIWFGWNDYAAITGEEGETLGALYSTDITTFYGAWNTVLAYLINKYPYTKICLCVPYGANGDLRNAVRAVADYWGVACWDNLQSGTPLYFNKEYGVTVKEEALTHNRSIFQANGAHPNYKGHKQLADMLENHIRGI